MINLLVIYSRFSLLITIALYILGGSLLDPEDKNSKRDFIGLLMLFSATLMVSTILVYRFGIIGLLISVCVGIYMIIMSIIILNAIDVGWKHPRLVLLIISIILITVLIIGIFGGLLKNPDISINLDENIIDTYLRSIRRSIIRNIR